MAREAEPGLRRIALLTALDDSAIDELEKRCTVKRYRAHEQIIDRDDEGTDVYFITRGSVRVVNYSLSGREVTFDDIEEGACFGELAALDGDPRSANVVALTDTVVHVMPSQVFRTMLSEHTDIALNLMNRMARIIRTSTTRIMDLSTLGAHNRVYAEILRLAKPNTREDESAYVKPIPIHGDIASRVSTTRETVARVLSDLSRKGIVVRSGGALEIPEISRLADMVEQFRGD
ncbi:MAG: Crp/Fnr family transcriptional regulator [Alphaproteobacteria bacterium]|nr:Crp/Fnr family transcriptional regulator [Alphaproteobacteria bacterium]